MQALRKEQRLIIEHTPQQQVPSKKTLENTIADQIIKLAELKNQGILTDDEFKKAKKRLIERLNRSK